MTTKISKKNKTKIFVLDTNVLMYDPASLFRFKDNDLFMSMTSLEELDNNKKGMNEVSRNARQATRLLDEIITKGLNAKDTFETGFSLRSFNGGGATGKLFISPLAEINKDKVKTAGLPENKADNDILAAVLMLKDKYPTKTIVMVSKDINLRIKSRALGIDAEDYTNDHVVEDSAHVYTGFEIMEDTFWEDSTDVKSYKEDGRTIWELKNKKCNHLYPNQFIKVPGRGNGDMWLRIIERLENGTIALSSIVEYSTLKNNVWGINARNPEQNMVLNLLLDENVDFITILGRAGSGKTMLTLASALNLLYEKKLYEELIFTRITVPVGEEIGFLPGTEEEKMRPWMGALEDNLEVLTKAPAEGGEWGKQTTKELVMSKIKIKSMTFMRGRTFLNRLLVIDEAQNLTPKQMKTLLTRAGPGTKIICMGNLAQIDAPYLTESNCGLTYAVERMKSYAYGGHITLSKVERSRLAEFAESEL